MKRVNRRDLEDHLFVVLKTLPKTTMSKLRSRLPQDGDDACSLIAKAVAEGIDNSGSCVVVADQTTSNGIPWHRGEFGKDEPWPGE